MPNLVENIWKGRIAMDIDRIPRIDTLKESQELADAGIDPEAAKAIVALLDRSLRTGTISRAERDIFEAKVAKSEKAMVVLILSAIAAIGALAGVAINIESIADFFS